MNENTKFCYAKFLLNLSKTINFNTYQQLNTVNDNIIDMSLYTSLMYKI